MKQLLYIFVAVLTLGLGGCKKLVQFKMEYNDTVTIPANTLINLPIELATPQNTTNSEEQFSGNGTASNLISKVALTNLDLSIVNPASETFDFLKSVEIYLSAPDLAEIRVAYINEVPATGLQQLPLTCEDVDLKEYLKKSTYSIRVKAVTDEALANDTQVNIHSRFAVDAGIF